ncbi:hypothetical protein T265_14982, partial [Opisthorchis viverrini]
GWLAYGHLSFEEAVQPIAALNLIITTHEDAIDCLFLPGAVSMWTWDLVPATSEVYRDSPVFRATWFHYRAALKSNMHILLVACGTYDGAVFALAYIHDALEPNGPKILEPVLLDASAHVGPVTAISVEDPFIVSGSADEAIQLFSVPGQMRLGSLELHSGTIRHLEFCPKTSASEVAHLLSASDDGCIAIWRQKDLESEEKFNPASWECIRLLRRHKGPVRSLAIHPSLRCAYSISEDKTFRIWNLLRGRQAYATRLKLLAPGAEGVVASPSGRRLLFLWPNRFQLIDLFAPTSSDSDGPLGCLVADVLFPQPSTASPVFFNEDDHTDDHDSKEMDHSEKFAHVLTGFGPYLTAFRCPLSVGSDKKSTQKAENFGEIKLPGKRIKAIQVTSWPKSLHRVDDGMSDFRSRLVVVVTTESSGSHIRGYLINLSAPLASGVGFLPVFLHDVSAARVTTLSARWTEREEQIAIDDTKT